MSAILIVWSNAAYCQQKKYPEKAKVYNALVSTSTHKRVIVGILKEVSDSAIYLLMQGQTVKLAARVIDKIVIKRKGNAGRGALTGACIGMGLGAIIGFAGDDTCDGTTFCIEVSAGEQALAGAVVLGGAGALIGLGLGKTAKERIIIGESQFVFEKYIELLSKYTLREPR
jgi:hypothetical protein